MSADGARRLRRDAQRNRDALLESATAVFAERGVDASLEEIARRSGVGIGTLYRHFPTREALVIAAYRRGVEQLCDVGDELAASHPPAEALEQWMHRFVGYVATKRGLAATLRSTAGSSPDGHSELLEYVHGRLRAAMTARVHAAIEAGAIRPDATAEDLLGALRGICMGSDPVAGAEQARRLVGLLMDGLRYGVASRA